MGDVTGAVFLGFVEYLCVECGATVLEERDAEGEVEHTLLQGGVDVPVVHEPCGVFFGDDDEGVVGEAWVESFFIRVISLAVKSWWSANVRLCAAGQRVCMWCMNVCGDAMPDTATTFL